MKKSVLLMAMLGMMLTTASPALAAFLQEGGAVSSGSAAEGTPPPLPYELQKDGTLVVGGDVLLDCPSEFRVAEQYAGTQPSDPKVSDDIDLEQNARVVRLCEANGFSPSSETAPVDNTDEAVAGNGASNVVPSTDTPALGQDGISEGSVPVGVPVNEDATLPDTGGIVPLTLLGSTGALLLLLVVGLLTLSRRVPQRRN